MSIYTRRGDSGTTALFGGQRVKKYDLQVETYGSLDELNASISVAAQFIDGDKHRQLLFSIEQQLFYFAAEIASTDRQSYVSQYQAINNDNILALEQAIDGYMAEVGEAEGFVLPGQTKTAALLHLSRTIARRAERYLVQLNEQTPLRAELLQYLNRLSDLFYAMARQQDQLSRDEWLVNEIIHRYQQATQATKPADVAPSQLDFITVHNLLKDAVQAALDLKLAAVIAVVDQHGQLIIHYRMPDSLLVSIEMAMKKAYSAVAMRRATHQLHDITLPGNELYQLETMTEGKIVTFGGGYPLYIAGRLVGGLGISGGSIAEDMQIAQAALHRFNGSNQS